MSTANCSYSSGLVVLGTCLVLSVAGSAVPALAQCELARFLADDAHDYDQFGVSVAIDGDAAVIGADNAWGAMVAMGAAYVFRFDGLSWVFEQGLVAPDADGPDHFGISVAIDDDTIVVGAHYDDDTAHNCGSAYVFRFDGSSWVEQAKLLALDGAEYDYFGTTVAVSGDTALICSRWDDDHGEGSGSVYVFRRDDNDTPADPDDDAWLQRQKLVPDDGGPMEFFGYDAAIAGETAAIGARWDGDNGYRSGSAYIFRRSNNGTPEDPSDDIWAEEVKLLAADGAVEDWFGVSVDVAGNVVTIGAERDDDSGEDSGTAYVFEHGDSGWVEVGKLLAADGDAWDHFGCSVDVFEGLAVIGAHNDGNTGQGSPDGHGSAYVFRRDDNGTPGNPSDDSWVQEAKLRASDGAAGDSFGASVGVSDHIALIGAYLDNNENGVLAGSAYAFDLAGPDCNENGICDGRDIAEGTSDDVNCNVIPDECECLGDLDGNGEVGLPDLARVLTSYGTADGATYPDGDLDCDGDVDLSDLAELLSRCGDVCE